jgi:hypothetical protein
MTPVLAATKLRNQLRRIDPFLVVELKNVRVNRALFGCSGFVTDGTNWVYVNTDHNHGTNTRALYRTATGPKDYTGGRNRYADYGSIAEAVVDLLQLLQVNPKEA